jgi:hypothetical protein
VKRRQPSGPLLATLALAVVAVAAGVFLWSTRGGAAAAARTGGGQLLGGARSPLDALVLNRGGLTYRFDRVEGGGWTLGGALTDDVDPKAMAALVDTLEAARAGPLLPGTVPEDRRYEFNGPEGLHLTLHRVDGTRQDLALGTVDPLSGARYASGAGRRFCFTAPAALRDRLAALPDGVRARTLLPGLDAARLDRVLIERDGQSRVLGRHDGRWWLLAPEGPAAFGPVAAGYQALYDDRRRTDAEGPWLQASTRAVEKFLYEISESGVREMAGPERTAELSATWQLAPPWRRVTLQGTDLRPALRGTRDQADLAPSLAFGPRLDERLVPVLRHGNVLAVDREAVATLEKPLAALLELNALPVGALGADAVAVTWEGRPLLRGSRRGQSEGTDGRAAWLTDEPAAAAWSFGEPERHGLVRDLIVNLGRQPIVQALPPRTAPDPLRDDGRVGLSLTFGTGAAARTQHWELGWLREPPAGVTTAVWEPGTGRLLAIPEDLLVSTRNAARLVATRR